MVEASAFFLFKSLEVTDLDRVKNKLHFVVVFFCFIEAHAVTITVVYY
jgi:hypothetical protein